MCVCVCVQSQLLNRGAWTPVLVEGYNEDFNMYSEALRHPYTITPGSDEALALLQGQARGGDKLQALRQSVSGAEVSNRVEQPDMALHAWQCASLV